MSSFSPRIQIADDEYKKAFNDELAAFKQRIRVRAKEKVDEQMEELRKEEEKERLERLGPGGVDPMEVFESLPKVGLREWAQNLMLSLMSSVFRRLILYHFRQRTKESFGHNSSGYFFPNSQLCREASA